MLQITVVGTDIIYSHISFLCSCDLQISWNTSLECYFISALTIVLTYRFPKHKWTWFWNQVFFFTTSDVMSLTWFFAVRGPGWEPRLLIGVKSSNHFSMFLPTMNHSDFSNLTIQLIWAAIYYCLHTFFLF